MAKKKGILTLGIHDGHTATACLMRDGEVVACISEERLNRRKEWSGFPEHSIRACLKLAGCSAAEIDAVGICAVMPQIGEAGYLRPHGYKKFFGSATHVLPDKTLRSPLNIKAVHAMGRVMFRNRRNDLLAKVRGLGITTKRIKFYEHHKLHAATAYYTNWYRNPKELVLTLDGSGDAVCASVSIGENGRLKRVAEVFNYNSICEFYTRVTQYLGMKPMSHEYKVMGLAPYASAERTAPLVEKFRKFYRISPDDPLQFENTSGAWKWQFQELLKKELEQQRFDWVAGAVQTFFEEICLQWVRNAIEKTGVTNLSFAGGGFMNVKLNYLISRLSEVDSLFVFPSCGDESNPIGAAVMAALDNGWRAEDIAPLGMVYWGTSYGEDEIRLALDKRVAGEGFSVSRHDDVNSVVAEKVADGKIVGRMTGRMEWGARALGNRSIVADPRNQKIIHKINRAIKMRDFWMPFAPAILQEYREKYLLLRDDYRCPFMTIATDTKEQAWEDIPAGLHPFDHTARAQVLDPESHPSFYDLVAKFERLSGVGGVLNTSFNLHGEPIVCTPEDAIDTFLRSDLDVLQLENFIVEK